MKKRSPKVKITAPSASIAFEVVVTPAEAEELAKDAAELSKELSRGDGDHFSPAMAKLLDVLQLLPQKL